MVSVILLCCPKIDSNGVGDVGDVGECWAILCLFCWGIGFRVLITSGYGRFPSHYQRLGLCHVNQTNLSNVDYCEGGRKVYFLLSTG